MQEAYRIADVSAASPDMAPADFEAFVEDIRTNGQLVPIWKCGGEIIDGRKRLAACQRLGVEPNFVDASSDQDPQALAVSLNILRTHYTLSQRAMFAAKRATATRADAVRMRRDRTTSNCSLKKTVAQAAQEVGVSAPRVQDAKAVRRDAAPEVVAAIETGKLTLHAAEQIVKAAPKKEEQPALVAKVIEASKGKKRHTPVGAVLGKTNGMRRAPKRPLQWRAERTLDQLDNALESMEAILEDAKRPAADWLDHLRQARTRLTRMLR